jgi:hypothetical protein
MVAVLASLVAAGTLAGPAPQPRVLVAGPALAGDRVVWGEQRDRLTVLRTWPSASPLWQSASSWFSGPLGGSQTLVAFSRSYDGCPGQPGVACPVETQAMAGPPGGSLRPLAPTERCSAGGANRRLSVSGSLVAFFALDCRSSAGMVSVRDGARTVFRHQAACCDVSLAGSRVAWRSGGSVDVFDLRARRIAYRTKAPLLEPIAAFDVQADGKLAVVLGQAPDGRASLAWRAPGTAGLQRLRLRIVMPAQGPAVRLVGDRIVTVAAGPGPGSTSELVVADLHGHVRTLARFAAPGRQTGVEQAGAIDANASRVTWASRRITSRREDCPPPGQGRPCRLLASGTETIWVAGLTSGAPHPVARWAFTDSP